MIVKEKDKISKYDWAIFGQSYFLIARLACQELLSTSAKKYSKSSKNDSPYDKADLFVATVFNVKHGIEVFIKAISLFVYGEYREGHNIHELFAEVKQKISKLRVVLPEQRFYNSLTQEEIDNFPKDLDQIELVVLYFYNLDFLKPKIGQLYKIKDVQNDIFRYPDNKAEVQIDWGTLLTSRIDLVDIQQIFQKLEETDELFNKVGYFLARLNPF